MILSAHHLRRHVAGRPRRVFWVIGFGAPRTRNTQIGDAEVPLRVKDYVLRLQVAMQDIIIVQVLQTLEDTSNKEL